MDRHSGTLGVLSSLYGLEENDDGLEENYGGLDASAISLVWVLVWLDTQSYASEVLIGKTYMHFSLLVSKSYM